VNKLMRNAVLALVGVALMIGASVTRAAETTGTFQASATINANCLVATNNLSFSVYDPLSGTDNDAATTISVRCTNGTGFTVALNAGVTTGATLAQRLMTNGTSFMNYNLYTTSGRTTVFGDGSGATATVGGTGAGLGAPQAQTVDVFGRIPAGQDTLTTGAYTETTITATVTF
jgi:spore coat protein U-like protein